MIIKAYKTKIGFKYYCMPADKQNCFFCSHCTDIYYDATNGPYMSLCDKEFDAAEGCKYFEIDKNNCEEVEIDTSLLIGWEEENGY